MQNFNEMLKNPSYYADVKKELLSKYGVIDSSLFEAEKACEKRIAYLQNFMLSNGRLGFTLGISGGVDSTLAGRLAVIACERLQKQGYNAKFYAVRLPAGVQADEDDAQMALSFINPTKTFTINIGETSNVLNNACLDSISIENFNLTPEKADYHKGNIKARIRMAAQYYIASVTNTCVIGTDHNGEAITGFWTTGGDNVCDLLVLNGMNKRQVRLCAKYLGAPERLWNKAPTADLEELNPGKLDDVGFGYSYEEQSDFLEGKSINTDTERLILLRYLESYYKRQSYLFTNT